VGAGELWSPVCNVFSNFLRTELCPFWRLLESGGGFEREYIPELLLPGDRELERELVSHTPVRRDRRPGVMAGFVSGMSKAFGPGMGRVVGLGRVALIIGFHQVETEDV